MFKLRIINGCIMEAPSGVQAALPYFSLLPGEKEGSRDPTANPTRGTGSEHDPER